jgi:hypothetical protein
VKWTRFPRMLWCALAHGPFRTVFTRERTGVIVRGEEFVTERAVHACRLGYKCLD